MKCIMQAYKTVLVNRSEFAPVYNTTHIHRYYDPDLKYDSDGLCVTCDEWACYISFKNEESFLIFLLHGIRYY